MLESDYLSGHNLVTTIIAIHLDPHHGSPLSPCIFPCTSQPLHTSPLSMGAGLSLLNVPLHQVSPESWRSCSQCTALSFLPNQSKGPGGFPHPRPLLLSELCPPSFLLPHLLQAHWPLAPLLSHIPFSGFCICSSPAWNAPADSTRQISSSPLRVFPVATFPGVFSWPCCSGVKLGTQDLPIQWPFL